MFTRFHCRRNIKTLYQWLLKNNYKNKIKMSRRSEHVKIMIHILVCKKKVNSILEEMSQQMDRKSIGDLVLVTT